jgi:hypothetical protein
VDNTVTQPEFGGATVTLVFLSCTREKQDGTLFELYKVVLIK